MARFKVVKERAARESASAGEEGHVGAHWVAVDASGEVVARYIGATPRSRAGTVKDVSGRDLLVSRPMYQLAHFRAWANEGFSGAFVFLPYRGE